MSDGSRHPYDTREGIATYLDSVASLERLRSERSAAGYGRRERLAEFCVLGRWYLDSCGNFSLLIDEGRRGYRSPASLGKCPPVMTADELELFMRGESFAFAAAWSFPPAYAKCTECGDGWTIENCHEFQSRQAHEEASLEAWVGQPLSTVTRIPDLVGKLWHRVEQDTVYSDVHQGETQSGSNGKPWYRVLKDHIIQPGDRAMLETMLFMHKACAARRTQRLSREEMTGAFRKAGFPQAQLLSIPNEYCPCDTCPPWYRVQVDDLTPFTIGWRKRVISIDWSETTVDLLHLFEGEDVTKERHLIHAWSYDKASEYLAKILPALGAKRPTGDS